MTGEFSPDPYLSRLDRIRGIHQERDGQYGDWRENLIDLSRLWSKTLRNRLKSGEWNLEEDMPPHLVAFLLTLLKTMREMDRHKQDNLDDLANYALFGAALSPEETNKRAA